MEPLTKSDFYIAHIALKSQAKDWKKISEGCEPGEEKLKTTARKNAAFYLRKSRLFKLASR